MPAISVRVKTRSISATGGDRRHNQRIGKQPDYVDASRTPENSVLLEAPTPAKMSAECLRRRQAAFVPGPGKRQPRSMAKDAAVSISGIVTFSTDAQPAIDALPKAEQDRRFLLAAEAVADHLGTGVAGVAVHRDESAIHCHFTLYGYGQDGQPISRKLKKKVLSQLQDVAATAFSDLGITRGKKIGERIKNGEPYSKTVNRSVRELHRDLPIELQAAREKVAEMQQRVATTRAKLEAGTGNLEKLQKRLKTYEKRLNDRKAEADRLADLAHIPEPKKRIIETPRPAKMGLFKQAPAQESLIFYTPQQMRGYAGKAKAQVDEADRERRKLARNVRERTKDYQHATQQPRERHASGLEAVGGVLVQRYGIMVTETASRVSVPPQKPASAAQIGAALYRAARDKNWETTHFSVSRPVAEKIIEMAVADGRSEAITFNDMGQRLRLFEEAKKAAREASEAAQAAKSENDQGDGKTDLEREHERRQAPPEGPDFDDEPSGPGMG